MRVLPTTALLLAGAASALGGNLREAIQANVAAKSTDYYYGDVTCTIKPDEYGHFGFIGQAPELYCHDPNPYNINNAYDHNYAGMITAPKDVDIWGNGFIDGPVQVTEMEFINDKSDDLKRREVKFRMVIETVDEHVLAEDDRLHGLLKHDEYASEVYPLPDQKIFEIYKNDKKTFEDAKLSCEAKGGQLATARNKREALEMNQIIDDDQANYQTKEPIWIGLQDSEDVGGAENTARFKWIDNTPSFETFYGILPWWRNQPNDNTNENCVVSHPYYDGAWVDQDCASSYGYICQFTKNVPNSPPSTYFTLEGTLTRYTSQAYLSNQNRRNPFPHCDRVASKRDAKDWFFWRSVKDVTITDSTGREIPFKKVEASLKHPFQIGCGANNVNRKLGIGATFELELDGHKLEFELFADMPAKNCAEHVYDYDLCYDENFKFDIDFLKDSVATKSSEEFEYIGGFCRTNEGEKNTGKFEKGCTKEKPCSIEECEKKCEEMKPCTGYEYTFRERKDGVICELHRTSVDFATNEPFDKDRCYKKK